MKNIVEVKNLSIDFNVRNGTFRAVDNINFDIQNNKTLALVGESGSGKTTLVNIICGFLKIKSGSKLINGKKIDDNKKANNKKVGLSLIFSIKIYFNFIYSD